MINKFDNDSFNKLETDIMKVLTREPDKLFTQYELFSKLLDEMDVKDTTEVESLKIRFLIVLRKLSSIFDYVKTINKNGILSVVFKTLDEEYKLDDHSDTKNDIKINKDFLEEEELKEEHSDMPSEMSVIQFIVDENIFQYYSKKDYDGNTILHKLVLYNDLERFKKIYLRDDVSLFELNNKNQTPIDLITDIKFSNLLIFHFIEDSENTEYELMEMKNKIKSIDEDLSKFYLKINYLYDILLIYILFLVTKFLFFDNYFVDKIIDKLV